MAGPGSRRRPLSLGRRFVADYLYFSAGGHTAAAERLMRVADIEAERRRAVPRPSWGAIMTKAFARAAGRHPEILRAYLSFPWAHLGECDRHVAAIIVNRRLGDEDAIFLATLTNPAGKSLTDLDRLLRRCMAAPLADITPFRRALQIGRLPGLLRRLLWWLGLNLSPRHRARYFGTFGVTSMSPFGAKTLQTPTLWTALLHYGALNDAGEMPVGIAFDHRAVDGAAVGYMLMEIEQVLQHEIVAELRSMGHAQAA
jgi:hypothetical protein